MYRKILKAIPIIMLAGLMLTACNKSGEIKVDTGESGYFTESSEQIATVPEEIIVEPTMEEKLTVSEDFVDMAINGTFDRKELENLSSDDLATLYVRAITLPLCETDAEKQDTLKAFVELYGQESADGMNLTQLFNKAVEIIKNQIEGSNSGKRECIDVLVLQAETKSDESLPVNDKPAETEEVSGNNTTEALE